MGKIDLELNTNVAPVVRVTRKELIEIGCRVGMSFPTNVPQVIENMKKDKWFADFLIRNFYDRDGAFDELKLTSWIENSLSYQQHFKGELSGQLSFDLSDMEVDINKDDLRIGDHVVSDDFIAGGMFDRGGSRDSKICITRVTDYLTVDVDPNTDLFTVID